MTAALVLLHGFTGSPSSFDGFVDHLAPGARVVRPALLGHDGAPSAIGSWEAEIERLARAIGERAGRGAHLVGYSLGARVGLSLLASHPGLVSGATLVGARLPPRGARERAERAARDEAWARRLETEPLESFVSAWEGQALFDTQRALPAAARARRRAERLRHDPRGLAQSLRVLGLASMPDLRDALPSVDLPVTLAVGSRDDAFHAHAEEILRLLPRARILTLEGAGHDLILERPAALAASIDQEMKA
jgi:2-succinyl-6-hydroxy-2,4-cyclohexadiene-1-carboxylate synthase